MAANGWYEGQMAGMYVLDVDKKPIWGINLWLSVNPITTITYDNGVIMDRNLGADISNEGTYSNWRSSGCFFQWGRPFAFPMGSKHTPKAASSSEMTSLAVSAENPYTMYYKSVNNNWYQGPGSTNDFWGNPNETQYDNVSSTGTKSIFDPCPKGYMVICPYILKEVEDNRWEATEFVDTGDIDQLVYKGAVWGFSGLFACDITNGVNWKNKDRIGYWSNSNNGTDRARSLFIQYSDVSVEANKNKLTRNRHKYAAHSIRCMVDTENR